MKNTGTAQYILVVAAAAVPANGPYVPLHPPVKIAADSNVFLSFGVPLHATDGIVVCNSSTDGLTKTSEEPTAFSPPRCSNFFE